MHITLLTSEADAISREIRPAGQGRLFCFTEQDALHIIAADSEARRVFELLAGCIVTCCRPVYIQRRITAVNPSMSAAARRRICALAPDCSGEQNAALADCLERAFGEHSSIDLSGLLRFRMKRLLREWNADADAAFAAAADESVYEEYTRVLSYYLRYAASKLDVVHIWVAGSRCRMTDELGRDIELTAFTSPDWFCFDMTGADMLLSTLLDLAPQKIVVHGAHPLPQKGLIYSIGRIFDDRVVFV